MATISLQLPPGVVHGANPDDAAGRWYDCNMIRWRDGVLEPIGGWERTTETPFPTAPRRIHHWKDNANRPHLAVGTDRALRVNSGGAWWEITPDAFEPFAATGTGAGYGAGLYGVDTYGTPRMGKTSLRSVPHAWTFANWGEDLLAVASSDGRLLYMPAANPGSPVIAVTGAPVSNRAVVVTPERHAMMIQVGGEPRDIGWSSREDVTDWNFASVTNTAGKLTLRAETPLLCMCLVREGTLVWSEGEAFLIRSVGLPYVYGSEELGTANILGPNTFAEMDGRCAFMDGAGFMLYEGGVMRPLESPLTDYVYSDMNREFAPRTAFAFTNGAFNEIWWHYPSAESKECDRFVVWNYVSNWWSMGRLSRSAGYAAGPGSHPALGAPDGHVYLHEIGWIYDGFDPKEIYVASGTLNIADGEQAMLVSQIIPSNGANYDMTNYTLFTRMTPAQAETRNGPYQARADGYVDTRAMGRDVRIRIGANRGGDWSIGRMRAKVAVGGRR